MISFEWIRRSGFNSEGDRLDRLYCVHQSGRVYASIEFPQVNELCFECSSDYCAETRFVTLEAAKRWCEKQALGLINSEIKDQCRNRRENRRKRKGLE
jgi:hypothetical protein